MLNKLSKDVVRVTDDMLLAAQEWATTYSIKIVCAPFLNRLRSLVFKIFNSFISSVAILCFVIDYRLVKLYTVSFS